MIKTNTLNSFYGIIACSLMPHWACHYYRIETQSSFVIGSWRLTILDSYLFIIFYSLLIVFVLLSIRFDSLKLISGLLMGCAHITFGIVHLIRLFHFFQFEIFNLEWSLRSSFRESLISILFGLLCFGLSVWQRKKSLIQ